MFKPKKSKTFSKLNDHNKPKLFNLICTSVEDMYLACP